MSIRLEPDDDIGRFLAVWLGPPGYSLPFRARYAAYAAFAAILAGILLVEAALPFVSVSIPPVWEVVITILVTTYLMGAVDHDRPVLAVLRSAIHAVTHEPRSPRTRVEKVKAPTVKTTRSPL